MRHTPHEQNLNAVYAAADNKTWFTVNSCSTTKAAKLLMTNCIESHA